MNIPRRIRPALGPLALLFALAACGDNLAPIGPDAAPRPTTTCGDGLVEGDEDCDDGDTLLDPVCDPTCQFTCGNGIVEADLGELCDLGATTAAGRCPTACDDGLACTSDVLSGSDCTAACMSSPIAVPVNADGCCPPGANSLTDSDCDPACGNSLVEAGEACDTAITAGAGACPTTCNDGQSCTTDALTMGGSCQATCVATPITQPIDGDTCCPPGATPITDRDCGPGCGNGVVDAGETCDTAIAIGAGACPTLLTCNDNVACTTNTLRDGGTCTAACAFPAITACANGDQCCPGTCNATNDDTCMPRCGNAVVEAGEQCDDGNQVDTDACSNLCRVPVVAFRFTDLDLRDPHAFVSFLGCRDVTPHGALGFSVNDELRDNITMDGDADGLLDLAPTLVFRNYNQSAATQPVELHFANCTAPVGSTRCSPSGDQVILATATNMSAGQCLTFLPGTIRSQYMPAITATSGPCFVTNAVTVTLDLGGIPITLRNARFAATYAGNPATTMTNGLLMGFISETDANTTIIPTTFPIVGGQPLSSLLPGGTNNCASHDDKDVNGVPGWWFYLNYPTARVPWSDN